MQGGGNGAGRPAGGTGAGSANPRARASYGHPKHVLYDEVYEPLTLAWFVEFNRARHNEIADILAKPDPQLAMLENLNDLFYDLVERAVRGLDPAELERMVDTIRKHQAEVMWVNHVVPSDQASATIRASLIAKLQRNISMGVIEAVLCLEEACRFALEVDPRRRGRPLKELLLRSRQLYVSLAVLHDNHEQERFKALTGADDFLKYPDTDYHHVLDGKVAIASTHLMEVDEHGVPSLKLRTTPRKARLGESPVKKCPAQKLRVAGPASPPLNDRLWDLLIEVYDRCGRFD